MAFWPGLWYLPELEVGTRKEPQVLKLSLEGPADEVAEFLKDPAVRRAIGVEDGSSSDHQENDSRPELPPDVQSHIDSRCRRLVTRPGRPAPRRLAEKFVSRLLDWDDVEVEPGRSQLAEDGFTHYLRASRVGSSLGSFVYFDPRRGGTTFRLPAANAEGHTEVTIRKVKKGDPYKLNLRIQDEASLELALSLARQAYEELG